MATRKKRETPSFEEALGQLEALVEQMEAGDLSLEESLAAFERGVALTRTCEQALKTAEQRVEILTRKTQDADPEPFRDDD